MIVELVEVSDELVVVFDDRVDVIVGLDLFELFPVTPNLLLHLLVHTF